MLPQSRFSALWIDNGERPGGSRRACCPSCRLGRIADEKATSRYRNQCSRTDEVPRLEVLGSELNSAWLHAANFLHLLTARDLDTVRLSRLERRIADAFVSKNEAFGQASWSGNGRDFSICLHLPSSGCIADSHTWLLVVAAVEAARTTPR